jgi:hypothetical protein
MKNKNSKLINVFVDQMLLWINGTIFKYFKLLIFTFFIFQFSIFNCNNKPILPPDDKPIYTQCISLTTEEIGVTDAWLRIKFTDTTVNRSFKLVRDGQTVLSALCSSLDTVVLDENLLPNHTYKYKALRLVDTMVVDSALLDVPTMDVTSHEFTWQVDTLGEGTTMIGRDVCIINDTCVWVVGEFNVADSLTTKKNSPYNAAHWNGLKWEILMVPTEDYGGYISNSPLLTVYGFSPNNVWTFGDNGAYSHWNGLSWKTKFLPERRGFGHKFWGTSSNNLYLVGTNGSISHFDGVGWQLMESGTDVDLTDVWGSPDGSMVWATAYSTDRLETYLLKYDGTSWKTVYDGTNSRQHLTPDSISGVITSVWTNSNNKVFVGAGAGIFLSESNANWKSRLVTPFGWLRTLPHRIRGNDVNDMFIVGTYGFIGHYNGSTCKQYSQFYSNKNKIYSVSQKGNLVVAVGITFGDFIFNKAVVFIGRR